jgi:hypothetical protein
MPNEPQTTLSDAGLPEHLAATVWELNGLPAKRMAVWIEDALAGRKVLPVGMPGDDVADTLVDLDPCLEDLPRRAFHDAVRKLVQQSVKRNEPDPLRLLLRVAVQCEYRSVGRDLAVLVTRTPQYFDAVAVDSRCRILSVIQGLHVTLAPEFWEKLAQRDAALYGGIAFAALVAADPARAISLLPQLPPRSDALTDVFEVHLPLAWYAANPARREQMRLALAGVVSRCPEATRNALNQLADDLGIDVSPAADALIPGMSNVDAVLNRHGYRPEQTPTQVGLAA